MSSVPLHPSGPAATKNNGPHHRIIDNLLRLLDQGPPEGMTINELAAHLPYARSTVAVAAVEARKAGLIEVAATRPGNSPTIRNGGARQNVWRRTAAGQP